MQKESKAGDYLMIHSEQVANADLRRLLIESSDRLIGRYKQFAQGLDEIASLLSRYDPAPSPTMNAIDSKAQDLATYFFAAYAETNDLDKSMQIYKTVKSLIRYIILMDRYYEVENRRYEKIARGLIQTINTSSNGHLKYSINFAVKQFWPFWNFEQLIKKRMIEGQTFTLTELRRFNLFKSSDAPLIYCCVLDSELTSFNPNVAAVMHYNQALQDIYDDFEDIEEDLRDTMPNIFMLAAVKDISLSRILKDKNRARKLIVGNGAPESIISIVTQYDKLVKDISIPPNFAFLKHLAQDYTNKLLTTLNAI